MLDLDTEIANLKLTIAKMKRDAFGASSERGAKLIEQLELQLAELVETVTETKVAAEIGNPESAAAPDALKPARRPLPEHLPRERLVHAAPTICPCCSGTRLRKLGEDTTESLDRMPARRKVIVHVRERLACRTCDTIVQTPAPAHPIARGRASAHLLADVLFGKFAAHLPLNRQSGIYAGEGVDLDVSTLADWVGACAATLEPLREAIARRVLTAERIHAGPGLRSGTPRCRCSPRANARRDGCGPMCVTTRRSAVVWLQPRFTTTRRTATAFIR